MKACAWQRRLFLKLEGFETLTASSALDAETQMHKLRRADVVIADFHLDGSHTGLDVLTRVRAFREHEIPGIILSGDLPSCYARSKIRFRTRGS